MNLLSRLRLRDLLTLPYGVLMLVLAAVIGALAYGSGRTAIDTWSGQLLVETVERIAQSVRSHVGGSASVLDAAFPAGVEAPATLDDPQALASLRSRFWVATSVHREPHNYAYYGDRDGRFFGLWRHSATEAELRLRTDGQGPRRIQRFSGIAGALGPPLVEERVFEPRERPWYRAGLAAVGDTWTPIYIDFRSAELVTTRARRVVDVQGAVRGVVATDLPLKRIATFLQQQAISRNGLAMVVETDGQMIGVSRGAYLREGEAGQWQRLNAADSGDALIAASFAAVRDRIAETSLATARTAEFRLADGREVQVGFAGLRDEAGLDWKVIVAVPRDDFLQAVQSSYRWSLLAGALALLGVAGLGLWVLRTVTRELGLLADAARRVGDGDLTVPLDTERRDELGDVARAFSTMQRRLMTDQLTGLSNRTAVLRALEERIRQHRRSTDTRPFVVLFADFNRFKEVNDRFGHEVGDRVLREMAQRLRHAVRSQDVVARYAGDEFVVFLESAATRDHGEAVRSHLESALAVPLDSLANMASDSTAGGASIGLSLFPDDGDDVEALIRHADANMYARKAAARPGSEVKPR